MKLFRDCAIRSIASAIVAVAITLAFGVAPTTAAPIDVRYSLWAKPGEAQHTATLKFAEVLEKESNGKFKVTVYPGNQLGTPKEMLAQLALNITQIEASGDPGLKEMEMLALPYLMNDMANYTSIIASPVGKTWNERLIKERKVRLLGILPRSPRQISANKVINGVADLKGMKIRVPERDYYVQSFIAFGAKPTPMAFKEVYTSLQTGVVDGQENPIETIWAMKFHEVQKSVAIVDYIKKPAWVKISEPFWQTLSTQDRELFQRAQRASEAVVKELLGKQQKELIAKMEAAGLVITHPDQEEFRRATQIVRDTLGRKTWGEALYKQIVEIGKKKL